MSGPTPASSGARLTEIKAIQSLLADVYRDAGDGRTLFRELVQNADDARAHRLGLVVLERGWPDARNSLLVAPRFSWRMTGHSMTRDREALHKAIADRRRTRSARSELSASALRASSTSARRSSTWAPRSRSGRGGVLNPWAGTGENGDADPLHPDWDEIDVERMRSVTTELLGNTGNGLLLWIPLRRPEHLDRGAEGCQYGLGERCPRPDDLFAWFGCSAPAALLLAQCGHLQIIGAERAAGPESLHDRVRLVRVVPADGGMGGTISARRRKGSRPDIRGRDLFRRSELVRCGHRGTRQ